MNINDLNLAANLGLLTAGAGLLEGQSFNQALRGGLGAYSLLDDISAQEEERRRQEAQRLNLERLTTAAQMGGRDMAGNPVDVQSLAMAAAPEFAAQQLIKNQFGGGQDRIIRTVPGVGLVDATNPNDPKVIVAAEQQTSNARRFSNLGPYTVGGKYVGEVTLDRTTGERFIGSPENRQPLDPQAQPRTEGFFNIGVPTSSQFTKLRGELKDDQVSLQRYTSYLGNIEKAGVGLERLGDQMSSFFKTLLSTNAKKMKLTEQELALRIAQGELQGLLGRSRIETVGGGVMTEQDALRVLQNLGGDVTLLQKPEVVTAQISRLFEDKYRGYADRLKVYNNAIDARYADLGFKKFSPVEVDTQLLDPAVVQRLGLPAPAPTIELPQTFSADEDFMRFTLDQLDTIDLGTLTDEQKRRLLQAMQR